MNSINPQALVEAGLFPDEQSVIEEAVRVMWQERPDIRLEWAIHEYRTKDISVSRAASRANVSFDRMKERLIHLGIQPRLATGKIDGIERCRKKRDLRSSGEIADLF